jgi:hypothetical protein
MRHRTILTERADRWIVEFSNTPRSAMMLDPNLACDKNRLLAKFALPDASTAY